MKNQYLTPADFWKERDFGTKISAVFEFIGVHWRVLAKCLVYFVLPFSLLMGVGLGTMNNSTYNRLGEAMERKSRTAEQVADQYNSASAMLSGGGMLLGVGAALLAFLVLTGTVYGYVRVRLDLPPDQPVTPALVWAQLRQRLGRTLLLVLLASFAYGAVIVAFVGGIAYFATQSRGGGGGVGAVLLTVLLGFVLLLVVAYLGVVFSLYFPVLWFEDGGVFTTIGRCFQLIRGQWWATFLLLLITSFIQSFISILFAIPQYAVMMGKMFQIPYLDSDLLGIVTNCIYSAGILFTYPIPLLAIGFQYFNLVEQREGRGLRLLVGELGQSQAVPVAHSSHYRPDEEGEY